MLILSIPIYQILITNAKLTLTDFVMQINIYQHMSVAYQHLTDLDISMRLTYFLPLKRRIMILFSLMGDPEHDAAN